MASEDVEPLEWVDDLPGDMGNEPTDGSYPPDGEDILTANGTKPLRGHFGHSGLLAKERSRRAVELRKAGASFEVIAQTLGYASPSGAHAAVKRAMDRALQEPVAELRQLQYERYNHMLMLKWPQVQQGDDQAFRTALDIMDRQNRLMGADAPQRIEQHTVVEGAVVVAEVDRDKYIAAMQQMTLQREAPKALPGPDHAPTGMIDIPDEDINEIEVIDGDHQDGVVPPEIQHGRHESEAPQVHEAAVRTGKPAAVDEAGGSQGVAETAEAVHARKAIRIG